MKPGLALTSIFGIVTTTACLSGEFEVDPNFVGGSGASTSGKGGSTSNSSGGTEGEGAENSGGTTSTSKGGSGGGGGSAIPGVTYGAPEPIQTTTDMNTFAGVATDGTTIYWGEYDIANPLVHSKPLAGGASMSHAIDGSASQLAIAGGSLYILGSAGLHAMPGGGGTTAPIDTGVNIPFSTDDSYVYYAVADTTDSIRRRSHGGTTSETMVTSTATLDCPVVAGNQLYYIESPSYETSTIMTAPAEAGATGMELYPAGASVMQIVVDAEHIYFSVWPINAEEGRIARVDLSGDNYEVIYTATTGPGVQPHVPEMILQDGYLYFQDRGSSGCGTTSIKRLSIANPQQVDVILDPTDCAQEMAVHDEVVYFTALDPRSTGVGYGLYRAAPE